MKLKQQIEYILRNIPETRNSDIALMIEVWSYFYPSRIKKGASGERGVWLRDLYDLPREDNIKRVRAKFNSEGKYFPTDWEVAKARGIEEDNWRVEMGYPRKDQTKIPSKEASYMDETHDYQHSKVQDKLL